VQDDATRQIYYASQKHERAKQDADDAVASWYDDRNQRMMEREARSQEAMECEMMAIEKAKEKHGDPVLDSNALAQLRKKVRESLQAQTVAAKAAAAKKLSIAVSSVVEKQPL
jgi:hypothetical protein